MVMARQMLLTQANRRDLQNVGSQDGLGTDAIACVRYFWGSSAVFYVTEFDGEDTLFGWMPTSYGATNGEWCYQSLSAFEANASHRRFGGVERDMHFTPCRVSEVREF